MKQKEFSKFFTNETAWNNAKKVDKKIKSCVKLLNNVLVTELFDNFYKDFKNESMIDINKIKSQVKEINKLLYKREIVDACRRMKGFMEDCLTFICQNHDINSVTIHTGVKAVQFRDYLINNNEKIFSILNEEVSKEYDYLSQMYNYIAKIDHSTSLNLYTKNLEQNKKIRKIEYSYFSMISFLLFLLFDFICTKKSIVEENEDLLFVIKTVISLNTIISISFLINFDKTKYLNLQTISFNSPIDEKYIDDLRKWNTKTLTNENTVLSTEDTELLNEIFKSFDNDLKVRGYITDNLETKNLTKV